MLLMIRFDLDFDFDFGEILICEILISLRKFIQNFKRSKSFFPYTDQREKNRSFRLLIPLIRNMIQV